MMITTATAPASWCAYSHGNTSIVWHNGVRWGEVEVGDGFAITRPRHRSSKRFEGCAAVDLAWQHLLPSPLPASLALDLWCEAEANRIGVAS